MPGSPSSRLPVWMVIVAVSLSIAIVIAAVMIYFFRNVFFSAVGFFGSVFVILIIGFLSGFGQQVQYVLAQNIFTHINNFFKKKSYEGRYRSRILKECDVLDTTGLPAKPGRKFQLAHVFVEPYLINKLIQRTSNDLIKPPDLSQGEQTIWDYLAKSREPHVILGVPGSGKTTLLKHIASEISQKNHHRKLTISNPHPLPFLLPLRHYGEVIKRSSSIPLVKVIETELSRWEDPPLGWVADQLTRKGGLILMDGLDEVADEVTRRMAVNWIHDQMMACDPSQFVITSRPYGYKGNELSNPVVLEIQSFTPEQISDCIDRWYREWLIAEEGQESEEVCAKASKKAADLRRRMRRKHALWNMAINPFLLHMIAIVHDYGNTLPEKRVELYREICRIFLGTRDEARNIIHPLSPSQQQWVLENLAYQLMLDRELIIPRERAEKVIAASLTEVDPRMSPGAFLDLVETRSGLLQQKEMGIYGFAHKVFQEYLASAYISGKRGDVQDLIDRIDNDFWHETILLYCAQNDASPLIEACLAGTHPPIPMIRLALECRNEAQRMKLGTRTRLDRLISQEGVADQDPISRRDLAEALLGNRLSDNQFVPLSEAEDVFVSPLLISCIEYQLFLDEQEGEEDTGHKGIPDHWKDTHFLPGQGQQPVLGIRASDAIAFCTWLTDRENSPWHYRIPVESELQEIRSQLIGPSEPPLGSAFWFDSGKKLAWVKKPGQSLAEQLFQEGLVQDHDRLVKATQRGGRDRVRACLNGVKELTHVWNIQNKLVQMLSSIRNSLNGQARDVQSQYNQVEQRISQLSSKLKHVQDEQISLQARQEKGLTISQYQEQTNQATLAEIRKNISDLSSKIEQVDTQISEVKKGKNEYQDSYKHEEQKWIFKNKKRINTLQAQIGEHSTLLTVLEIQRARYLQDQARMQQQERQMEASVNPVTTPQKISRRLQEAITAKLADLSKEETDITANLEQAQKKSKHLAKLLAHLNRLSGICENALTSALTYKGGEPPMKALARNTALHFDVVLKPNNNFIIAMIEEYNALVKMQMNGLVTAVTQFISVARSNIDDSELAKLSSLSDELIRILESTSFQHDVELLVDTLQSFLNELITFRPLGKTSPLLRVAIRYFAWELAECLSYWPETKQASPSTKRDSLKVRDTYLDIAVALVVLEERIKGNLAPTEGLVIIRERKQQD